MLKVENIALITSARSMDEVTTAAGDGLEEFANDRGAAMVFGANAFRQRLYLPCDPGHKPSLSPGR